jgi:type II secretory pathway predicted ATPase ExeA
MVLHYYNLKEQPFGVTPDPRYLYLSPTHREALASLLYGIRSGRGFLSIVAEPGMGKTTILSDLLSQLQGSARTAFLFQTVGHPEDLLRSVLRDLGVDDDSGDIVRMQELLNNLLMAEALKKRRVVVVIDEAQNLEDSSLELLRMMSNFETASDKLMQVVLAGQPGLREKLASPGLLQLRQRMSIFARLQPLSIEETGLYVDHRLRVAGYNFKNPLFTPQAAALIAKYSEGIPRNINNICFNALSLGYVSKQETIQEEVVRECLCDLDLDAGCAAAEPFTRRKLVAARDHAAETRRPFAWRRGFATCVLLILLLTYFPNGRLSKETLVPHSVHDFIATPQMGSTGPDISSELQLGTTSVPRPDEISVKPEAASPTQTQSQPHPERAANTADLWALVRQQNSDAEVELARLYLQGVVVPQSCAQAQVLLLAASRRGNARAGELLDGYGGNCR